MTSSRTQKPKYFDELKTDMLEHNVPMRSQTLAGVRQELWGVLLAYNLVRREMEQVANEANVSPLRISFIASYRFIRDEFLWCAVAQPGTIPAHLKRLRQQLSLFLLPKRRSRHALGGMLRGVAMLTRAATLERSNEKPVSILQNAKGNRPGTPK